MYSTTALVEKDEKLLKMVAEVREIYREEKWVGQKINFMEIIYKVLNQNYINDSDSRSFYSREIGRQMRRKKA